MAQDTVWETFWGADDVEVPEPLLPDCCRRMAYRAGLGVSRHDTQTDELEAFECASCGAIWRRKDE